MSEDNYLMLPEGQVWEIDSEYDPTLFFRGLRLFEGNLTIYIECSSLSDDIGKILQHYATSKTCPIKQGTIWPKSKKFHLALSEELIIKLIDISENYPVPDFADHIVLYGNSLILEAYDFARGPIHINSELSEELVKEFSSLLDTNYKSI